MNYVRWYDKIPELKNLLELVQSLPDEYQNAIAQDMLHIIFNGGFADVNNSMAYINQNIDHDFKRWYDLNPELSSALEVFKHLEPQKQQGVLLQVAESVYQIMLEYQNEQ